VSKRLLLPLPLLLLLVWAIPAGAHAILMKSSLAANSVLNEPAIAISLTFNSRIDGGRSRLNLIGPDSSEHKIEFGPQKSPGTLTAQLQDLKSGAYRLQWEVLALDGHITRGQIPFRVLLRKA
jgi:methionine-rich copper-binding protein CopC